MDEIKYTNIERLWTHVKLYSRIPTNYTYTRLAQYTSCIITYLCKWIHHKPFTYSVKNRVHLHLNTIKFVCGDRSGDGTCSCSAHRPHLFRPNCNICLMRRANTDIPPKKLRTEHRNKFFTMFCSRCCPHCSVTMFCYKCGRALTVPFCRVFKLCGLTSALSTDYAL
jgi:hypothetical protein